MKRNSVLTILVKFKQPIRVLLVEPNYKNKYPPLGLMKLATYHRTRGDYVRFFKGEFKDLISDIYTDAAIKNFVALDPNTAWHQHKPTIHRAIRYRHSVSMDTISQLNPIIGPAIGSWLKYYATAYSRGKILECASWDRICVTTLFTFYFKKTIETIEQCKRLLKQKGELFIGGVMASLIPDEIKATTGIAPIIGLLDKPGMLDSKDKLIIDNLPLDYSILEEIDYRYPESDGYYGYTSRGCIRHCKFCAVPHLEPVFKDFIPIADAIKRTDALYGGRRNLLLLDNNVLASKNFPQIIKEIHSSGFKKGAIFKDPNFLEIAVKNLKNAHNEFGNRRFAHRTFYSFRKRLSGEKLDLYNQLLDAHEISEEALPSKEQVIEFYEDIKDLYEFRRNKLKKFRYVDFNQGVDARLLNEEKMKLLSTIPIRPLRIAFDSMKYAKSYENALRLASRYNIYHLSNYLLYNFEDEPIDLYRRMRLNVDLSEELELQIYSFPMRYSPIWDENNLHHNRNFIGKHWNKKFIRSIQTILNATKGKVGTRVSFFNAAFGKNEKEFIELLYMPEAYILQRHKFESNGLAESWRALFYTLTADEKNLVFPIIESNQFSKIDNIQNEKISVFISHYFVCSQNTDVSDKFIQEIIFKSNKYKQMLVV